MNFSISERIAFKEVNAIISIMGKEYKEKVPNKLLEMLKKEEAKEYKINIKKDLPFEEQKISRTALILLNYINRKYWIESDEQKKKIKDSYKEKEEKYQNNLKEEYNLNEIFKKRGNS